MAEPNENTTAMAAADDQITYALPSLLGLAYYACDRDQRKRYDELPVPYVDLQVCCDSILKIIKFNRYQPSGHRRSMFSKVYPDYRLIQNILEMAAHHGHIECLKLGRAIGVPWYTPTTWQKSACDEAAFTGNLECLAYAHENGSPWSTWTCSFAVEGGHLNCLRYCFENGCPWDDLTSGSAVRNGRMECLVYARENNCPWSEQTCNMAALYGQLECLVYCHENGCPWDSGTCELAASTGRLDCLKYARENGCPWNQSTCILAAYSGQLECLRYAFENGCEWDVDGYLSTSNDRKHPACVAYALEVKYRQAATTATTSSTDEE